MDIRPIFSTLARHKTAAALIVLEIALACAIVCNALFMILHRVELIGLPSGLAEAELVRVSLAGVGTPADAKAETARDLELLRSLPGVKDATTSSQVPFGNSESRTGFGLTPNQQASTLNVAVYAGAEHFVRTLGLRLVAGRDFNPEEYDDFAARFAEAAPKVPTVIVSRAVAERLFPGGDAVGRAIYGWDGPSTIVGIVDTLVSPNAKQSGGELAVVIPYRTAFSEESNYLLRVADAGQRDAVLKAAVAALQQADGRRLVLKQDRLEDIRNAYFQQDRAMVGLLGAVCVALLVVTALGIVGLASFWVQQRTRMIGIRRALGATRGGILAYFQTENFLLATLGIAIGMAGAYGINQLLMTYYELPRLPAVYLPTGALALWALGQLAVLGPALRAAALPPVVVMRLS